MPPNRIGWPNAADPVLHRLQLPQLLSGAESARLDSSGGRAQAGGAAIRRNLFAALDRDELVVVGSQFHLEEASRMSAQRAEWMRFFWDVVKWNLLLATTELVVLEAKHGRPLQGSEPYDEYRRRQRMRDKTLRWPELDSLAPKVAKFAADSGDLYKDLRDNTKLDIAARFKGKTNAEVTKTWWANAGQHIPNWVLGYMRLSKARLGLHDDESVWPKPEALQTAWAMYSYQMARIVLNVGLGRKVRDSDLHDAHHYAMASYADVLVTQDGGIAETVRLIPNSLAVIDFNDFAARLGVTPH